jgi:hypothetical protein
VEAGERPLLILAPDSGQIDLQLQACSMVEVRWLQHSSTTHSEAQSTWLRSVFGESVKLSITRFSHTRSDVDQWLVPVRRVYESNAAGVSEWSCLVERLNPDVVPHVSELLWRAAVANRDLRGKLKESEYRRLKHLLTEVFGNSAVLADFNYEQWLAGYDVKLTDPDKRNRWFELRDKCSGLLNGLGLGSHIASPQSQ